MSTQVVYISGHQGYELLAQCPMDMLLGVVMFDVSEVTKCCRSEKELENLIQHIRIENWHLMLTECDTGK